MVFVVFLSPFKRSYRCILHSDHDDHTPNIFLFHLCIKDLFSYSATNLALLSFRRKDQRKGWTIDELGTLLGSDGSNNGCVIAGVNMLQGKAGNILGALSLLDLGNCGSCVNV